MHERNFVICDKEQQYARNLLKMLGQNRELEVRFYLFHTIEELREFARQKKIDMLLIGDEYPQKFRERIPAEERFVLVKGTQEPVAHNETRIYRYQSADEIWTQILDTEARREPPAQMMAAAMKREAPARLAEVRAGELIGVYSPIHRIGKTRFALKLGKELSEKVPVLYLNLEEYAGNAFYFPNRSGENLADLLYYARQKKGNLGIRVSMMAVQTGKLDYIRPMRHVQDMQAVEEQEWLDLFRQLLEQCIYEKIILDLGDSVNGLFGILDACGTIYTPYIEEKAAMAKLADYTENLRRTGLERVLEKTIQKKMG